MANNHLQSRAALSHPSSLSDAYTTNNQGSPSIAVLKDGYAGDDLQPFRHDATRRDGPARARHQSFQFDAGARECTGRHLDLQRRISSTARPSGLTGGGFVTIFNKDMSSGENQLRHRVFDSKGVASLWTQPGLDGFTTTKMGGASRR